MSNCTALFRYFLMTLCLCLSSFNRHENMRIHSFCNDPASLSRRMDAVGLVQGRNAGHALQEKRHQDETMFPGQSRDKAR